MDEGNIMAKACFGISIKVEVGPCHVYVNILYYHVQYVKYGPSFAQCVILTNKRMRWNGKDNMITHFSLTQ